MYFKLTRLWDRFLGGDDCSVDHNSFFVLGQFQGYQLLSLTLSYLNFSPILIILKCPPSVLQKSFLLLSRMQITQVSLFIQVKWRNVGFENEAKKVTNHFPFPIIFESGKKKRLNVVQAAFIMDASPSYVYLYHTTPLTCKLSKLLKIIFLLTVVLVTTAACSNTREP